MPLFSKNKEMGVQSFILSVVNNNCPDLAALIDGPRLDRRVNLTVVVMVIPLEDNELQLDQTLTVVTKEFSTSGLAIVLDHPRGFDQVLLGFRWEGEMNFVRASARHLNPIGGGFYQLGFQMTEIVHVGDYPQLKSLIL